MGSRRRAPPAARHRRQQRGRARRLHRWRRAARGEALGATDLADLCGRVERPLVRVMARMEAAGVKVDRQFLEGLRAELAQSCEDLVGKIQAHAGMEFNVNSTPQLRQVLFEKLGLAPVKKTKTGPSTDADSLQKMADEHPIIENLLRYREDEKLRSTNPEAWPRLI